MFYLNARSFQWYGQIEHFFISLSLYYQYEIFIFGGAAVENGVFFAIFHLLSTIFVAGPTGVSPRMNLAHDARWPPGVGGGGI